MRALRHVNPTYRDINNWDYGLENLFRDIDQMLEPVNQAQMQVLPACDVTEDKKAYYIALDLPGVKRRDIEVTIEDKRLTIAAKRDKEHLEEDAHRRLFERKAQIFARNFTLPDGTDIDRIEAEFEDGVLRLHVPKNQTQQRFKLNIGAARKGADKMKNEKEKEKENIKLAN